MLAALIGLVVLLGVLVFWWMRRSRPAARARRPVFENTRPHPRAAPPTAQVAGPVAEPVQALRFDVSRLTLLETLDAPARQALLAQLRDIPRPPRALHQLLSPEFRTRASSTELAELVMTEPVVAARVMGAVNSPLYGLRKPVTSLGQAITFLGLNSVRNLCLQYLMVETLAQQHGQALRAEFDTLGQTSMVASELVLQMAKRLQLPDAAALSTQLVLSYLGRFAAALLLHKRQAEGAAPVESAAGLVPRALAEQARLGLASGEIGLLLMQDWGLPDSMVGESRGIARILFAAEPAAARAAAARAALCALGASLAERLVRGQLPDLSRYEPLHDEGEDLRALRRNLPQAMLEQVGQELREAAAARKAQA
ncbi:HDOD domain-containing protein [Pseudorhodoferax sp. Leaf267]|uniref:HDOD domain-containing protein n=1 Tax=Pseudorhodoferax sp. Leaf267 TaxID=1736316 RepID=UPI0006F94052|nr:HDOD domain-containing protein [Pseudorhodoferax sp. Leaf267]KQP21749.1 hypothetical protein ASF43_25955 [Pseudorhodoferax sp. Leaf267]